MRISKPVRVFCSIALSLFMTPLPSLAEAKMISTSEFVTTTTDSKLRDEVRRELNREDVKEALAKNGISEKEISQRLASLSESELRQLSGQIKEARAGGDILFTVLIVVLIIFLVKRI